MTDNATLSTVLLQPESRPALIQDCVAAVEAEVASKSGITGIALKGAYKSLKAIQPGFMPGMMDVLLEEWTTELDGEYQRWRSAESGDSFASYLMERPSAVAAHMLAVTDRRAERSRHVAARKLYFKLRPKAKEQVLTALPRVANVLSAHLNSRV